MSCFSSHSSSGIEKALGVFYLGQMYPCLTAGTLVMLPKTRDTTRKIIFLKIRWGSISHCQQQTLTSKYLWKLFFEHVGNFLPFLHPHGFIWKRFSLIYQNKMPEPQDWTTILITSTNTLSRNRPFSNYYIFSFKIIQKICTIWTIKIFSVEDLFMWWLLPGSEMHRFIHDNMVSQILLPPPAVLHVYYHFHLQSLKEKCFEK